MKNIFSAILLFSALLFSCSTENTGPKTSNFLGAERGGCADGLPPSGIIQTEKQDTVYYSIKDNKLFIFLGFNATCCIFYDYKVETSVDKIEIELMEVTNDPCDCICWYEFTFEFIDLEKKIYNFEISVEDYISFEGKIDLRE